MLHYEGKPNKNEMEKIKMKNRNTYQLRIDGNVSGRTQGCIQGIIFGVTNTTYMPVTRITYNCTGLWVFKRKKVMTVVYDFRATVDEATEICSLVKYIYEKDEKRNFGFGIKLKKAEA